MGTVRVRLATGGDLVQIDFEDFGDAPPAELQHGLFQFGAQPVPEGYTLDRSAFRHRAVELARLLRDVNAEVDLDEATTELLRAQLEEIRARPREVGELESLGEDEVLKLVLASGRLEKQPNRRQLQNIARLLALRHGANFSVPGAGKTLTLLALYEALREQGEVDRLLVVAPKNAFISWEEEVWRCYFEDLRPRVLRLSGGADGVRAGLESDPEIALITYQLLANVHGQLKEWAARNATHVTLDESHRIKQGREAVSARAALELADSAVRRDILSGTPLPQEPEDLRAQLEFLWPGQRIVPDAYLGLESDRRQLEVVERSIAPLYVRTTKKQLELPKLVVKPKKVELGPLQRELYELLRSRAARATSGLRRADQRAFRLLGRHVMRLLQAAVNPMLLIQRQAEAIGDDGLDPIGEGSRAWELLRELARDERPAKIETAVEMVEETVAEGEKVLLWSQFVKNVQHLERRLEEQGVVVLYGAVPTGDSDDPDTREGRIRLFHEDDDTRVMIANPAAAGEGISLHRACHRAIYVDRSFNAAHFLQSVDRIHRLGLEPGIETRVDILEAVDTIDCRVTERLNAKLNAMQAILYDEGLRALTYDPEDVTEQFPGGIEPGDVETILEHLEGPGPD